jgi:hypothetical protein
MRSFISTGSCGGASTEMSKVGVWLSAAKRISLLSKSTPSALPTLARFLSLVSSTSTSIGSQWSIAGRCTPAAGGIRSSPLPSANRSPQARQATAPGSLWQVHFGQARTPEAEGLASRHISQHNAAAAFKYVHTPQPHSISVFVSGDLSALKREAHRF